MKIEHVVLHKLQTEDLTEGFSTQHGINSQSADCCKDMLQLWCNKPAGEILSHINLMCYFNVNNNSPKTLPCGTPDIILTHLL